MPEDDELTGPDGFAEIPFEEMLRIIHAPLEANPELNDQADQLFISERFDELIHQLAHRILVLGMMDPSACGVLRPILVTMMALGYVLGATGEKAAPDDEPKKDIGPIMGADELNRLMGDIDLGGV
jgi:hypothetical protein